MDDLEDLAVAEQRLADIRAGKSKTVPLDDVMQMFGDAYDSLKENPGTALSADQVREHLAAQGGQAADMTSIPRRRACPCCGMAALVSDTRDHATTIRDGRTVLVKALRGDYCDACGEVILDADECRRYKTALDEGRRSMTVADLIQTLQGLPPHLPVMIPAEGGIDLAGSIRVATAARHPRDWADTPVGQYRELPDDDTVGKPFSAVIIDLDGASR